MKSMGVFIKICCVALVQALVMAFFMEFSASPSAIHFFCCCITECYRMMMGIVF